MFAQPDARQWWLKVGSGWSSKGSRRERKFIDVVTEECTSATHAKSPSSPSAGRVESVKTA
jgi:hypothetical protein